MSSKKNSYSSEMLKLESTANPGNNITRNGKNKSISDEIHVKDTDTVTFKPFLGLFYIILHATSNQLASVIVKKLPYVDPGQLSLLRHVASFTAILPMTIYHSQILGERKDRLVLLLRGLCSSTGIYMLTIAYSYLPLAEASIIMSTLPIITAVMARILLKEPYGLIQSISLIMTVCGVLLALRIPILIRDRNSANFDFTYVSGLVAAVGNVLLISLSSVYIRKLKKSHFSTIILYGSITGIAENLIINGIFIPFVKPTCGWDVILCILYGIFCFAVVTFITVGFQTQPAGLAAIQKSSFEILISIPFQIIFLSVHPDMYVISGACLVIISLVIIGFRNWVLIMPGTSKVKIIFKWLL